MATKKKLLQAAAGTAAASGGAGALSVEDVFSTYLYEGNGDTQVIENGINLGQSNGSGGISLNLKRLNLGTAIELSANFTIEAWVFIEDDPESYLNILGTSLGSGDNFQFGKDSDNRLTLYNGSTFLVGSSANNQIPFGEWVHVAVSRSGTTIYFFVNGTLKGTATDSTTFRWHQVGQVWDTYYEWDGYLSGLRILDGTALYTSSFTAPTSNLTAITNTVLLLGQGDTPLVDGSTNSVSITNTGVTASTFGPHDADDAGEGGLVWLKARNQAYNNNLFDTERGIQYRLNSNTTSAQASAAALSVTSSGFVITSGIAGYNGSGDDHASWSFRKAPKFFDVVTYTGNGVSGRTVSHNLGSVPGCIIVKCTSNVRDWYVYHRGSNGGTNPEQYRLSLNTTAAAATETDAWNNTAPTSSVFTVGSVGNVNASGFTYVAYLFAHNDGDGEFGPDGDADIIKCGSFTGAGYGASDEFNVDLGFEPQWIMYKRTDNSTGGGWFMVDNMRGWRPETSSNFEYLQAQSSDAESQSGALGIRSDGFRVREGSGRQYIYIAIRRGPMAVPTDAADVFAPYVTSSISNTGSLATLAGYNVGFPADLAIQKNKDGTDGWYAGARLTGTKYLKTETTAAEASSSAAWWDSNVATWQHSSSYGTYNWRRAPNYFDVVAYSGTGANRTISHNLGVTPEMIWVKRRDSTGDWIVYHKGVASDPETDYLVLNSTAAAADSRFFWNDTAPTSSVFSIGTNNQVNQNVGTYIAYLFASLDGVSKVGSYTGTGAAGNQIDCGFSNGARFVLIKGTDTAFAWVVLDTERGLVSGSDKALFLNSNTSEITFDYADPYSAGFELSTSNIAVNGSGYNYIFYAIA
jgi:hypothetical protein